MALSCLNSKINSQGTTARHRHAKTCSEFASQRKNMFKNCGNIGSSTIGSSICSSKAEGFGLRINGESGPSQQTPANKTIYDDTLLATLSFYTPPLLLSRGDLSPRVGRGPKMSSSELMWTRSSWRNAATRKKSVASSWDSYVVASVYVRLWKILCM